MVVNKSARISTAGSAARARTYERYCLFCGQRFLAVYEKALFCSQSHQARELEAIHMLERTTPPEAA